GFGEVFNDTAQQNAVVNVWTHQYDGQDRLTLATAPEGGTIAYAYSPDFRHNVVQVTRTPKPGSPLSATTPSYTYDFRWNKPVTVAVSPWSRGRCSPSTRCGTIRTRNGAISRLSVFAADLPP
ncbi:MAG: hypothetical protein IT529_16250, partial [Burkholderiales bacterium]|nr:hypothetical protein [Burkholderiales bacterium]